MVKKITSKEFAEVRENETAVVDFSAAWCGPCRKLAPVLEKVSEELDGNVTFYNIDVDENPELAQQYDIMSIPALVVLKNGDKKDMLVGYQTKDAIISFIKAAI